jgi:hypothetical protein
MFLEKVYAWPFKGESNSDLTLCQVQLNTALVGSAHQLSGHCNTKFCVWQYHVFFLTYKTTAHFPHSYNVAHFPSEKKGNYIKYTFLLHD